MSIVLKVDDLVVSYPREFKKEKIALNGVSLEVKRGEILGLLGPNGAGKTTLIKALIGLIRIKKGAISFFGETKTSTAARNKIGYMPEIANYYWFLNPEEILHMFGRISGMKAKGLKDRIDYVLKLVGLLPEKNQLLKNFSKGMQERLSIAQALLHDPELLILDEPFSGLDPLGRIHIRNILKGLQENNKTILLSSHELSEAELICDYVCIMKGGKILKHGLLKELLEEKGEHTLERYFLSMIGDEENG